jgi:hypothetical protein
VQGGGSQPGREERRLDNRNAGPVESRARGCQHAVVQPAEALGRFLSEYGGAFDRGGPHLNDDVSRGGAACGYEPAGLRQPQHLADDNRPVDDRGHLGVAADQESADLDERVLHRGKDAPHDRRICFRRDEDDSQEPARTSAGHREVVRVDDDRQPPDLLAAERDRIARGDEHAAGDLDCTGVLADAGPQPKLGRRSWELVQQLGQEIGRDLPASKWLRGARRSLHRGRDYGGTSETASVLPQSASAAEAWLFRSGFGGTTMRRANSLCEPCLAMGRLSTRWRRFWGIRPGEFRSPVKFVGRRHAQPMRLAEADTAQEGCLRALLSTRFRRPD